MLVGFWQLLIIFINIILSLSLDPTTVVLAMNTGGITYVSAYGFTYSPDTYNTQGSSYFDGSQTITQTLNGYIYQSERVSTGTWGYDIPVSPDGTYVLILEFAEIFWTVTGNM
ncbi:unnamed protein product [Blepharisma stoltei]|uniref:Malectin domain-containing protein n=1 Tax=Blepharisma stoltei TaxID=1481888 RepID=A0AAU9KJL3_9CILI|nr:unnamed protein product [Blepharisma stoltei]